MAHESEFENSKLGDVGHPVEDPRISGTAGAGRDPAEQKKEKSRTEESRDRELGEQQQQRQTPPSPIVEKDIDDGTNVEERVDVGTKNWR